MLNLRGKESYLNLAFQGIEDIPSTMIRKYARGTTSLDLSYNNFRYPFPNFI